MPGVRRDVDAQIADHTFGDWAVRSRALDGVGAAVAKHEGFVHLKFVALGVAAEIIVVF